ncbi:hypothetical protein POF50_029600 [Streptomyces sp. SL13]|uniref:Secreted protein n=1 Tax=Streptantibioticus silvisoli TaxID=2705255 RepID=A0AA90H4S0_9ACTN|nr:hypothetical protein [Streptantibioticus silvisoli]MDI5973449.1 hypothetical protein [Streptantibioticus silvisoli]
MSRSTILSRRSKAAVAAFALLTAGAVAGVTTAGSAQASAVPRATPGIVHPMDGSGTVTDPWVPEKNATIVCDSATQFGNYTPGVGHSDPINTLYRGTAIGVRYETSDHNSVMAYYAGADTKWGFVLRSCVQFA